MVVSLKANRKRILAFILLAAIVGGGLLFPYGPGEEPGSLSPAAPTRSAWPFWRALAGSAGRAHRDPGGHDSRPVQRCVHRYNVMQQAQASIWSPTPGKSAPSTCTRWRTTPGTTRCTPTLLVYGDEIIGGDIASTAVDGFMHGFASDSAHFGESGIATATPAATASPQATVAPESSAAESAVGSAPESAAAETAQGTEAAGVPLPEDAYPVD